MLPHKILRDRLRVDVSIRPVAQQQRRDRLQLLLVQGVDDRNQLVRRDRRVVDHLVDVVARAVRIRRRNVHESLQMFKRSATFVDVSPTTYPDVLHQFRQREHLLRPLHVDGRRGADFLVETDRRGAVEDHVHVRRERLVVVVGQAELRGVHVAGDEDQFGLEFRLFGAQPVEDLRRSGWLGWVFPRWSVRYYDVCEDFVEAALRVLALLGAAEHVDLADAAAGPEQLLDEDLPEEAGSAGYEHVHALVELLDVPRLVRGLDHVLGADVPAFDLIHAGKRRKRYCNSLQPGVLAEIDIVIYWYFFCHCSRME